MFRVCFTFPFFSAEKTAPTTSRVFVIVVNAATPELDAPFYEASVVEIMSREYIPGLPNHIVETHVFGPRAFYGWKPAEIARLMMVNRSFTELVQKQYKHGDAMVSLYFAAREEEVQRAQDAYIEQYYANGGTSGDVEYILYGIPYDC